MGALTHLRSSAPGGGGFSLPSLSTPDISHFLNMKARLPIRKTSISSWPQFLDATLLKAVLTEKCSGVCVCVISKVSTIQQAFLLQIREAILFAQHPSCTRKLVSFGKGAVHGGACLEFQHFGGEWTGS